jgi:glycine/D-amino acid oxidase-like deaminating enzyme
MAQQTYDVAVIGGGIAGCASAYYLARRGLRVILLEKGEIAGEQSGRNWGFVRQQGRDPREIPLMIECNRMWRDLSKDLEADLEWRQGGLLYLAENDKRIAEYEAWLEHARDYQLDSRLLSTAEATALVPGITGAWAGALHTPSDGQADPVKTTQAFAVAARRHGAEVVIGATVEEILTGGGAVTGLRGEDGEIRAGKVLVAAGAWTSRFLRPLGIELPQLYVKATVVRTNRAPEHSQVGVWCNHIGFRQRRDGSFNVAPGRSADLYLTPDSLRYLRAFWPAFKAQSGDIKLLVGRETWDSLGVMLGGPKALARQMKRHRVLDPKPNAKTAGRALTEFKKLLPAMADLHVETSWAGMIEATPDEIPVLDAVPDYRGLYVATGFSGHGFGMGPITGRLMAETIADDHVSLDLSAFRFSRFAEAKSLTLGDAV